MPRISRRCPTLATLLMEGTRLTTAIAEEGDDLSHVQDLSARLGGNLDRIRELSAEVDVLKARKQALVQEIYSLQEDSAKAMAFLHASVMQRYGRQSERLLKFGLQPFRGPKKSRNKPEASSAPPEASRPSQD